MTHVTKSIPPQPTQSPAASSLVDQLLTTDETAAILGLRPSTLRQYRKHRKNRATPAAPRFIRLNPNVVRYRASDVAEFIRSQKVVHVA
jgi:predicted DNA-binding transcriptional regulator AlpA